MNNLKKFLKKQSALIIWTMAILIIFALITFLTNQDFASYFIAIELIAVLFTIYLAVAFLNFKAELALKIQYDTLLAKEQMLKAEFDTYKNESKEYFMLLVHQIKTPITAAGLLLENDTLNKTALRRELLYIEDYVNMSIAYLKLIETNTDMDIYPLNLDTVIKTILKKYAILFIEKQIKLTYKPEKQQVISDERWLSLLIEQIVSNAVKYSKNGEISICFNDDTLFIKDTGIGIKAEDIHKIFDIGYSGFNGRMNQKSSGLGLYLASKIAKKLNIAISVESELGKGSCFMLKFL